MYTEIFGYTQHFHYIKKPFTVALLMTFQGRYNKIKKNLRYFTMKKVHGQNLRVKYYPEGGDKISLLNIVLNSISL